MNVKTSATEAIALLDKLISTPSVSRSESGTADILFDTLRRRGIDAERLHNNVWAKCSTFDSGKPTLLLNSHHDTVKPSPACTNDPFTPLHRGGCIFG